MSRPTMQALLRAQSFESIDAARNGGQGARHRTRTTLRLPPDLWDRVKVMSEHFQLAFPDRYVTTTSTVEFLLDLALDEISEKPRSVQVSEPQEDEQHECE